MLNHQHTTIDSGTARAVRDAIARAVAVTGLAGVALIHVLDSPDTFAATPYKGVLYVLLISGALATAAALMWSSDSRAWGAGLALCLGTIAAFVYSRTIGLPQSADDLGNWWEPLGLASLFVEGAVAALCAAVLAEQLTAADPRPTRRRIPAVGEPARSLQ
jgi:hypothetical protein